jgi:hypothetical protein
MTVMHHNKQKDRLAAVSPKFGSALFKHQPPYLVFVASRDGVIGRPSLWIAEDIWVLRFRLMVKRGPLL